MLDSNAGRAPGANLEPPRPRGRGGSRLAPGARPALESSMKAAWAAATGSSGSSS